MKEVLEQFNDLIAEELHGFESLVNVALAIGTSEEKTINCQKGKAMEKIMPIVQGYKGKLITYHCMLALIQSEGLSDKLQVLFDAKILELKRKGVI